MTYSLAISKKWKRRKHTPVNACQDGTEYLEVSIIRDGLAVLAYTCKNFPFFIPYV